MRRKTTTAGLLTLVASILLFYVAFPNVSLSSDLSVNIGAQGLYRIGVSDGELASAIAESPKFIVVGHGEDADIYLALSGGIVSVGRSLGMKGDMAQDELAAHFEARNDQARRRLVARGDPAKYIANPLWVVLKNTTGADRESVLAYRDSGVKADERDMTGSIKPDDISFDLPFTPLARYFLVFTPLLFFSIYSNLRNFDFSAF